MKEEDRFRLRRSLQVSGTSGHCHTAHGTSPRPGAVGRMGPKPLVSFLWGKQRKSRWVALWRDGIEWRARTGIHIGSRDHLRNKEGHGSGEGRKGLTYPPWVEHG